MKGIKHGARDYIVKPVRLEQLRVVWTHVVKNSKTDDVVRKLPSGDGDKVEKVGANHTKKYSRKNKKVVDVADEANENTSTQKKQRVQWLVSYTGRVVPKKILEVMNVEGLTKENVAKVQNLPQKAQRGTVRNSNPFADETEALWRNHFAKMNSLSAIGTQASLPTESVQVMSSQKNMGIPQPNMEPVGQSVNLPKNVVPMPV
ncbi:unnamed protein product [Miscanthus lutarioriparius]|uniref:Response regulatory domain-containing protein n=1 Tax=Miscanthus lutarioriparius TaxID=422564 RepID=A0A811S5M5_9POAL|nr:unnamed protein product [Miscanthus lutarioriparius]CAD6336291.1 unnamed protein product [Miscanthus lutarioriparius]